MYMRGDGTRLLESAEEHYLDGHRQQCIHYSKIYIGNRSKFGHGIMQAVPDYDDRFEMGVMAVKYRLDQGYRVLRVPVRILERVPEAHNEKIVAYEI